MTIAADPLLTNARARVEVLPTRFRNAIHAYAAVQAWSADDRRVLYLGFDGDTARGHVVIQEIDTGEERVVADTAGFDFHTAAGQRWALHDSAVVYRVGAEGVQQTMIACADGSRPPRRLDLAPRLSIRHVCDDTIRAVGTAWMRGTEQSLAIVLADLDAGSIKVLMHVVEAVAALPEELVAPDVASYAIHHPVANGRLDRLFFKLIRRRQSGKEEFCALFVKELDSGQVRCLGNRINGHPVWMPDGRRILNVKSPRDGSDNRWLVFQDPSTNTDRRVIDLPIEGPGHPTVAPDGRFIATDAFVADGSASPIYLLDTSDGTVREIIRLPHRYRSGDVYDPSRLTRGQPHPVWSHRGDRLLVNCNNDGTNSSLLILADFLPD